MTFFDRFSAAAPESDPQSLQVLYFTPPQWRAGDIAVTLNALPGVQAASCELADIAAEPELAALVSADGPPARQLGLIAWGEHSVKLVHCDAPMPYGPLETCVGPALLPPPMKVDAKQHEAHTLLYYAGTHTDAMERFVALCAVAGALARFEAIVVLNEEARTACPAFDLIPDTGEDVLETYRQLPIPYLLGGFTKMDTGDANRPWVRTFANHRLGLPNLARQLTGHEQTAETFQLFAGMLGYLRLMEANFEPGDVVDLGTGPKLQLRAPTELEWFLDSAGPMLVIEPAGT